MHQLFTSTITQQTLDGGTLLANDLFRFCERIGHQPTTNLDPIVHETNGVATLKGTARPDHARRQKTLSAGQRSCGTIVQK